MKSPPVMTQQFVSTRSSSLLSPLHRSQQFPSKYPKRTSPESLSKERSDLSRKVKSYTVTKSQLGI